MSTYVVILVDRDEPLPRLSPAGGIQNRPGLVTGTIEIRAGLATHEVAATWYSRLATVASDLADWHGERCGERPGSGG